MDPMRKPRLYGDLEGNIEEVIKYGEEFRHNVLMEVKHMQDRVNKAVLLCSKYDEFLNEHLVKRVSKNRKILRNEEYIMKKAVKSKIRILKKYKKLKSKYLKLKKRIT